MKYTLTPIAAFAVLSLCGCGQNDNRRADIQAFQDNEARWTQEYAAKELDKSLAITHPMPF